MSDSKNNIANIPTGTLTLTGFAPTVTVSASEITEAIEKSELSLTEQTVLITIVTNITNSGIQDTKELLSLAYKSLIDTPELFNKLLEIIKQIC